MTPPAPTELQIQASFKAQLRYIAPGVRMVAIPNAAKRGFAAQRQARKEGLAAGVPDALFLWDGGHCFIEFKSAKGTLSENQREWIEWLYRSGHRTAVCRSVEEAIAFLFACGAPVRERAA